MPTGCAREIFAGRDALFVGETYVLEVPGSAALKPAFKEFSVNSEGQLVTIQLERRVGRA